MERRASRVGLREENGEESKQGRAKGGAGGGRWFGHGGNAAGGIPRQ